MERASCHKQVCSDTFIHFTQASVWLNERNAIALDENWTEPTNLQAKVLKHQSFEAEILANRYRVEALSKVRWSQRSRLFFFFCLTWKKVLMPSCVSAGW